MHLANLLYINLSYIDYTINYPTIDEGDDYDEQNILGTPCQLVITFSLKYTFLFIVSL